jgi:hypothetical protein
MNVVLSADRHAGVEPPVFELNSGAVQVSNKVNEEAGVRAVRVVGRMVLIEAQLVRCGYVVQVRGPLRVGNHSPLLVFLPPDGRIEESVPVPVLVDPFHSVCELRERADLPAGEMVSDRLFQKPESIAVHTFLPPTRGEQQKM